MALKLSIVSDANKETGVADVVLEVSGPTKLEFAEHAYGDGIATIGVVFMCRSPEIHFKQRVRFVKKERALYLDVMLDYRECSALSHIERRSLMIGKLIEELIPRLDRYSIPDFDLPRFALDLRKWASGGLECALDREYERKRSPEYVHQSRMIALHQRASKGGKLLSIATKRIVDSLSHCKVEVVLVHQFGQFTGIGTAEQGADAEQGERLMWLAEERALLAAIQSAAL